MIKKEELLPLGSIVYLEEGTVKLMIVGRGVIYDDPEGTGQLFADYMGGVISGWPSNRINFIFPT
ncbi:Uncharacterized protein conserved in bacteria [Streptococcus agalactiae]|nr:Uncharacterized protein conserved in bacteria [Streptococcus agalactiae]